MQLYDDVLCKMHPHKATATRCHSPQWHCDGTTFAIGWRDVNIAGHAPVGRPVGMCSSRKQASRHHFLSPFESNLMDTQKRLLPKFRILLHALRNRLDGRDAMKAPHCESCLEHYSHNTYAFVVQSVSSLVHLTVSPPRQVHSEQECCENAPGRVLDPSPLASLLPFR